MTKPQRNPVDVINAVLAKIPEDMVVLIAALNKVKDSAFYRPPEGQYLTWRDFTHVLNSGLPFPPTEQWQKDIYFIVTKKEWKE